MTEKEMTMEDFEETVKRTDEQLDLMEWKMDNVEKELVEPVDVQDACVMNLLKSVSEPVAICVDGRCAQTTCSYVASWWRYRRYNESSPLGCEHNYD